MRIAARPCVLEAQRRGLADQLAKDAAPAWQVADFPLGLIVDPQVDEALELGLAAVEHTQRGVLSSRQLSCGLHHRMQDRLQVKLGEQRSAYVDQAPEALFLRLRMRPVGRTHPLDNPTYSAAKAGLSTSQSSAPPRSPSPLV